MKEQLKNNLKEYVESYKQEKKIENIWREALACFADVKSPYIRTLKENVNPDHVMPEQFLEDATVVMVYFLPFTKEVIDSNVLNGQEDASKLWADAYVHTDELMKHLSRHLVEKITEMGYKAVIPTGISMDEEKLVSNWSHRHVAYAGGLGTFGINNMLITESGCSGRYASIITNLPVEPDKMMEEEYCIYKRNGKCKKCVENCPTGALTTEGFDRFKCFEQCMKNIDVFGVDVCGKCATGIPCALKAPM